MEYPTVEKIPAQVVNGESRWSLHRDLCQDFDTEFITSVRRFGIIRPPLLQQQDNGSYEIICGAKRYRAGRDILKQTAVNCMVLNSGLSIADLLLLVIEDQKLSSPLSPIEKARWLLLCRQMLANGSGSALISSALETRGNPDRLIALLDLEEPIRTDIHDGKMSEQAARELMTLAAADRQVLHHLFRKLSLNQNKQRRVIEMSRIAAVNHNITIKELFSIHYPEYCRNEEPVSNPPQATQHLLQDLGRRSSPLLAEAEKSFSEQVAGLELPPSCTVSHSKAFEQDTITLHVQLSNLEELSSKWPQIKNIFS